MSKINIIVFKDLYISHTKPHQVIKMKKLNKILFIVFVSIYGINYQISHAKKIYEDIIVSKVLSVYDGDTFRANFGSHYSEIIGRNNPIMLAGIDTPEIKVKKWGV